MTRLERILGTVCIMVAAAAHGGATAQNVVAANVWTRASVPGQKTAAAYLELTSGTDAAVVAVRSAAAERAELHSTTVEDGVMRMRPLARIDLPAGRTVKLAPAGMHVMLIDLKQPLKAGERVPLELDIRSASSGGITLRIEAEVREAGPPALKKHANH